MGPDDDGLQPEHVDEQIEELVQDAQGDNQSAQLVQRLQRYYEMEKQTNTLEHAWQQIVQRYDSSIQTSSIENVHAQNKPKKLERPGQYHMQQRITDKKPAQKSFPRWGTMLAIAVLTLVIGSTAVMMSRAALQNGSSVLGGSHSAGPATVNHIVCTPALFAGEPTPTPNPIPPTQPAAGSSAAATATVGAAWATVSATPHCFAIATPTPVATPPQPTIATPTVQPSSDNSAAVTATVTAAHGGSVASPTHPPVATPVASPTQAPVATPTAVH